MSFFAGTNGMDPSSKLPPFPSIFSGRVRIDACKAIMPRSGGKAFIAEVTVLTSNLDKLDPSNKDYVAVGSRRSWYQKIPLQDAQTAWGACIAFLHAALGLSTTKDSAQIEAEVKPFNETFLDAACNEDPSKCVTVKIGGEPTTLPVQFLAGEEVMLQTSLINTKKTNTVMVNGVATQVPGTFTLHTFSPAPPAAPAQAA